jgi:hypothetical protein
LTPLEAVAVIIIAGVIIFLLYYFIKQTNPEAFGKAQTTVYGAGKKVSGGVKDISGKDISGGERMAGVNENISGVGGKISGAVKNISGKGGEITSGVSQKISGTGSKVSEKVKGGTDSLSEDIDKYLAEKSNQIIKDWELATKNDIGDIEKKFNKVSRDTTELKSRFDEYRGDTNKKLKNIEERLAKLEGQEK